MYKRNTANATPTHGYSVNQPVQSTPNYGTPGQHPGTPQKGAATVHAQAGPAPMPNHAAPVAGFVAQPGTQPQKGPSPAPQQGFHQQRVPAQTQRPSGYQYGNTPYISGSSAQQMQPQPAFVPRPQQVARPEPEPAGYISSKICKINGKDKVVDFSSKLSVAKVEDFANIHGCGGKEHAANSTIAVTICDYSKKGKGEPSVTASYNLDAEIMDVLYHAAMDARLGKIAASSTDLAAAATVALHELNRWETAGSQQPVSIVPFGELTATGTALGNAVKANTPATLASAADHALTDLRRWVTSRKQCPSAGVPLREIYDIKTALANALAQQDKPLFVYTTEKNNPYQRNSNGFVPVSKLYISYTPTRKNGEISRYPWFIQIENFWAPLSTKATGASSHDASKAVDRKGVFINVSADDFAQAMVAVKRYIRVWEMVEAIPVVRSGLRLLDRIRASKQNKKEK